MIKVFNLMTKLNVPAENYPFCTIDPSEAKVPVPDKRFNWLCQHYKPKSEVKAVLTIHDIAGLVKGAAEGAGLGTAFLSHVRATDAMVRRRRHAASRARARQAPSSCCGR